MLLYAISRYVIEFYRGDPRGMVLRHVSTSQFISLILAPLSLAMLVWLARSHVRRRRRRCADDGRPPPDARRERSSSWHCSN